VTWQVWLQIAVFAALITAMVKPFGGYIMRNVEGDGRVQRAIFPLERGSTNWPALILSDSRAGWTTRWHCSGST
jgi:hypothetical protein